MEVRPTCPEEVEEGVVVVVRSNHAFDRERPG
jgi:hypothetical protein